MKRKLRRTLFLMIYYNIEFEIIKTTQLNNILFICGYQISKCFTKTRQEFYS